MAEKEEEEWLKVKLSTLSQVAKSERHTMTRALKLITEELIGESERQRSDELRRLSKKVEALEASLVDRFEALEERTEQLELALEL